MLETVSTTTVSPWPGYTSFDAYTSRGSAVSAEAHALTDATFAIARFAKESLALFGRKATAISQLRAMANDCAEPGWDGEQAEPIDQTALRNAEDFILTLPAYLPLPEFAPEPDGSISLDWIQSRHRLFSLSIGQSNRLAYAWLDGTDKGHGVARFDGVVIPTRLLAEITSITGYDSASLRAA